MIETNTHRGRWHESPAQSPSRHTLMERLRQLVRPQKTAEGRRRIDPHEAYGHWAKGFHGTKNPR